MDDWEYNDISFELCDWIFRDFLKFLSYRNRDQRFWIARGSGQHVYRTGSFEPKAGAGYNFNELRRMPLTVNSKDESDDFTVQIARLEEIVNEAGEISISKQAMCTHWLTHFGFPLPKSTAISCTITSSLLVVNDDNIA